MKDKWSQVSRGGQLKRYLDHLQGTALCVECGSLDADDPDSAADAQPSGFASVGIRGRQSRRHRWAVSCSAESPVEAAATDPAAPLVPTAR
ncbi:hypothetical protein [Streptomyces virginiae]|uniref:hypothetical protein n=1 Tax=Streptomyces virginiae TaxID=1961 RepID=UPI002DDAC53F|nr:hypothetical protein [Streptomyces virginiae]WSC82822.1 hypothetical protein OHA56_41370 [Streptomyces virginiae]